jgi:hypothetical protein
MKPKRVHKKIREIVEGWLPYRAAQKPMRSKRQVKRAKRMRKRKMIRRRRRLRRTKKRKKKQKRMIKRRKILKRKITKYDFFIFKFSRNPLM